MTLNEVIQDPDRKAALVKDASVVVEQEVRSKGGLGGMAVKTVFSMVSRLKPGIISEMLDGLIPRFVSAVDPILSRRPEGESPGNWVKQNSDEVVQALLSVTDERAERSDHTVLRSAYEKLRPTGEKHVNAAIPRLSGLLDKHLS